MMKAVASKVVKSYMRKTVEQKFLNNNAAYTIDFNGTIENLSLIPQGDTDFQRNGDMVYLQGISYNFSMVHGDTTNLFRVIIFRWNIPTSLANPTANTILDIVGSTNAPLANYVKDFRRQRRYTILFDRTYSVSADGRPVFNKHLYIKLRNQLAFEASGTTGRGHIFSLVISDSGAAPNPAFNWASKLLYTDS